MFLVKSYFAPRFKFCFKVLHSWICHTNLKLVGKIMWEPGCVEGEYESSMELILVFDIFNSLWLLYVHLNLIDPSFCRKKTHFNLSFWVPEISGPKHVKDDLMYHQNMSFFIACWTRLPKYNSRLSLHPMTNFKITYIPIWYFVEKSLYCSLVISLWCEQTYIMWGR